MASARSIEAAKAFVRVDADLSPLEKSLKTIGSKFDAFGSRVGSIGKGIAGVGAGLAGLGAGILAPIAAATASFADFGSTLKDTSDRTGISASALSELGFAAAQSGTDLATIEKSVAKMQKGIAGGSKAFDSLGLSAKQLSKLAPEQQFETVAAAIAKIQDPTQRAAAAMSVFGKSGTQLLPLIQSDISQLRREAQELGITLSDLDASNAEGLGDAFDKVKKSVLGIGLQVGAAIAEPLTKIATITASVIGAVSKWVAQNRQLVQTIAGIGAGLLAVGTVVGAVGVSIIGVGASISLIGTAIGSIVGVATAVFGAVGTVIGAVLSPIGLVVAAVVGLGAYITYTALISTGSLTKLGEMFGSLGTTASDAWAGIVAAVSTGDLETAGQIAFTALEVGWLTVTSTMQDVWNRVSDFFVNVWLSAVESIVQAGAAIYFGIAKYFDQLSNALVAGFDIAVTYITGAIDGIQTAIAKAIIKAQEFFGLFSADQSVQIQQTLDSDLQRRANGRQQGLDQRANDRGAALSQRDQQRQATADQFSTIVSEDFKRRKTSVDSSGLTAAQKRLAELQASLTEKSTAAQEKAAQSQEKVTQLEDVRSQAMAAIQSTSAGSVGTFAAGISNSIAGGGVSPLEDLSKQQVDLLASMDGRLREALTGEDE